MAADQHGDTQKAIALYQQTIALQPGSVPARSNLGVVLAHAGRYSEAITQYQEALKRDPHNSVIQLNLALARYKQADFEKAASELVKLRKQQPDNKQSLYLLADCYLRLGRNSDAVTLLTPAYQVDPADRAVQYALGTALIREGQIEQGQAVINRILKDGSTPEASLLMGEAQFAAGDYAASTATLKKAIELDPFNPVTRKMLVVRLIDTKQYARAHQALEQYLEIFPQDDFMRQMLARAEGNKPKP